MPRYACYGMRGMDSYGPTIEVDAVNEEEALQKAIPQLKAHADCYVAQEIQNRRHIDLEPDDGLGPALRDESGRMSENTHLVRRVLLLERTIKEAKAALTKSNNWSEHEARAYRILDTLSIPER